MLLFSNAKVKTSEGGKWVTAGKAGERVDEMEGKKEEKERALSGEEE